MWVELLSWGLGAALFVAALLFAASHKSSGRGGRLGNALQPFREIDFSHLLNLQSIYEPGKRHLLEQARSGEREEDDEGEPPKAGGSHDG